MKTKRHIVHIIYKLETGGLENGLMNVINNLPADEFSHTILTLTHAKELTRSLSDSVQIVELHKKPGPMIAYYHRIFTLLKSLHPDIVHTRNFSTIECQFAAALLQVPYRLHSEHGRDHLDLEGSSFKHVWIRKLIKPFIHQMITLSYQLEQYLLVTIGVPKHKLARISNGVDCNHYVPDSKKPSGACVIISVGRFTKVKNFKLLIHIFHQAKQQLNELQLWLVGDGSEMKELKNLADQLKLGSSLHFLGERTDINKLLAQSDVYLQTSHFEGMSNAILEAMSCGLPIVATDVGGNSELVIHGHNGLLAARNNPEALKDNLIKMCQDKQLRLQYGKASRVRAVETFSLSEMIQKYYKVYTRANG